MICSGCGTTFTEDDLAVRWCHECTLKDEEAKLAVERAKLRVHRILRAMRDRPALLEAMHAMMRPQTLEDAVGYLLCTMPLAELAKVKAEERDNLILYHHGFGRSLRNRFRLFHETQLLRDCCQGRGEDPDEASMAIIEVLWDRVQDMDLPGPTT